jgi:hypothetical protein
VSGYVAQKWIAIGGAKVVVMIFNLRRRFLQAFFAVYFVICGVPHIKLIVVGTVELFCGEKFFEQARFTSVTCFSSSESSWGRCFLLKLTAFICLKNF